MAKAKSKLNPTSITKNTKSLLSGLTKKINNYKTDLQKNPRKKYTLVGIVLLVALLILAYINIGYFVVTTVNNQPITRFALIRELEKQGGKNVLESMITQKLIDQEAKKENIVVTEKEIQDKIDEVDASLKTQGADLVTALQFKNQTMEDFEKDIVFRIKLEKLLADKVKVTDEEIQNYFDQNASLFEGQTLEEAREQIISDLSQQKLSEEYQIWITEIKEKAKINYLVNF